MLVPVPFRALHFPQTIDELAMETKRTALLDRGGLRHRETDHRWVQRSVTDG